MSKVCINAYFFICVSNEWFNWRIKYNNELSLDLYIGTKLHALIGSQSVIKIRNNQYYS